MRNFEKNYWLLVKDIIENGDDVQSRNSKVKEKFGIQLDIDIAENEIPLLTQRRIFYKGVIGETTSFLKGVKNISDFEKNGCNYWKKWADDENGKIRLSYGNDWLNFGNSSDSENVGINQIEQIVNELKTNPFSRRLVLSGWNPNAVWNNMLSLPCCHYSYQFRTVERNNVKYLDLVWIQRSADIILGTPSNMINAFIMSRLMAQTVNMKPGKIIFQLGNVHIYDSHIEKAKQIIDSLDFESDSSTTYKLNDKATIFDFDIKDIDIIGYEPKSKIEFELFA